MNTKTQIENHFQTHKPQTIRTLTVTTSQITITYKHRNTHTHIITNIQFFLHTQSLTHQHRNTYKTNI